MTNFFNGPVRDASLVTLSLLAWNFGGYYAEANPAGGTVGQGAATFSTAGSVFTINQTSANALINWQSFNIGAGETTTFVQPSSSSLVWNQINDANPSQILGNLNANGYVVLQNQHGFYVGGNAAISAHGLIMTTSPTPAPNLSAGSAWEFDTPPPTAEIINYGQITVAGGGPAYLIANTIENHGTISAQQGQIGLYAGKQVLVSASPDGRGLSAKVTLPQGSVDNEGKLIADGGTIMAMAQTVNQNGLVQANTVQNVNGVIELVASGNVNLGTAVNPANPHPSPDIEANGDGSAGSPGGMVVLQAGNAFSDTSAAKINVSGQGTGQDGIVEIFGNNLTDASSLSSVIGNTFALLINPYDITISGYTDTGSNPQSPQLGVSDLANYAQIDLHALDNIELSTSLTLSDPSASNPGAWGSLSLSAGNNIILDDGSAIDAGNNWGVNLAAGTAFVPSAGQPTPQSGSDGIYLNGGAYVQTRNGDITAWAANEVQINADALTAGDNGIRTENGGNINVTAQYGDVNTGANSQGFIYNKTTAPYYSASPSVGGISTAAGGNVAITAGGDVISYLPGGANTSDAGTGAFGPEAGNVTINAGGNVYGHYVLANGVGVINAGGNIGSADGGLDAFALSLVNGSWTANALNGNLYIQEVRNPNGVFNNLTGGTRGHPTPAGSHLFDYGAQASVSLNAGIGVYLTDQNLPRPNDNVPVLYPPDVSISAGSGGVTLEGNLTLFPSADQNLSIITTDGGGLAGLPSTSNSQQIELLMSDSALNRWVNDASFGSADHGPFSAEPTDPTPVKIDIAGNVTDLTILTSKATQLTVGGDMINSSFSGQNLRASDTTSLNVSGQIYNQSAYTSVSGVTIPNVPAADLPPGMSASWDNIFALAVDPAKIATLTPGQNITPSQWLDFAVVAASTFGTVLNGNVPYNTDQGFTYNAATSQLWFGGPMSSTLLSQLSGPNSSGNLTILHLVNGQPVLDANGHFETDTVKWVSPALLGSLFTASQADPSTAQIALGYRVGGPGTFDVTAGGISLGNSYGILSCGVIDPQSTYGRYQNLASVTTSSANLNVDITGPDQTATVNVPMPDGTVQTIQPHSSLDMFTSTIATLGGGNLNLTSDHGSMNLGTSLLFNTSIYVALGVYTAAGGDVNVTAQGDVNINGSRIATYNGGNIDITSTGGNVSVGSGGATQSGVFLTYTDAGTPGYYQEFVYGSGIVANTLVPASAATLGDGIYVGYPPSGSSVKIAKAPGNITVTTPEGDITSTLGGITQEALGTSTPSGPTISLSAGDATHVGNIDLGQSGVIGGSVSIKATGNIKGPIISRQNTSVQATGIASVSVLAGGSASVSGTSVSGVIVGAGGVSVSGGAISAEVLGQNVSVNGGASQSTLGTSANATATSQAAAQQATSETKQMASNDNGDDDEKKKKKGALLQRVKRVTVILPKKA
jgi:filamentous hemagglutinin family protein